MAPARSSPSSKPASQRDSAARPAIESPWSVSPRAPDHGASSRTPRREIRQGEPDRGRHSSGWSGTSIPGIALLTRDTGYFTSLRFGRFDGAVVPNHCADGTTTIAGDPASLVAWLEGIPALTIERTDVTVGGLSGVRLAIAATTKRPCTADPAKGAPEVLWVDPSSVGTVALDTGDSLVAYLLDDGAAAITIVMETREQELSSFVEVAEPVLANLEFRVGP